jgi:dihydroneopterin aldolase
MITIHLKDLRFHAHHGLYEEEKILGNIFVVNLHVHYIPVLPVLHDLKQVVNYERLFELTKQRMDIATPLLETVAMELCHTVMQHFNQVHAVFVSIEKTNPPIPSLQGSVVVAYQLSKEPDHLD